MEGDEEAGGVRQDAWGNRSKWNERSGDIMRERERLIVVVVVTVI